MVVPCEFCNAGITFHHTHLIKVDGKSKRVCSSCWWNWERMNIKLQETLDQNFAQGIYALEMVEKSRWSYIPKVNREYRR